MPIHFSIKCGFQQGRETAGEWQLPWLLSCAGSWDLGRSPQGERHSRDVPKRCLRCEFCEGSTFFSTSILFQPPQGPKIPASSQGKQSGRGHLLSLDRRAPNLLCNRTWAQKPDQTLLCRCFFSPLGHFSLHLFPSTGDSISPCREAESPSPSLCVCPAQEPFYIHLLSQKKAARRNWLYFNMVYDFLMKLGAQSLYPRLV